MKTQEKPAQGEWHFLSPAHTKFAEFHQENPDVYLELVAAARRLKKAGREKYGINSLIEVVRWHRALVTTGDDYKINNNFAPFYSRLIMRKEPDLKDFFFLREQKVT